MYLFDALLGLALAAALVLVLRPAVTRSRDGKIFAFAALFLLPLLAFGLGGSEQLTRSEQTRFCLSCHIMAPWGKSLYIADARYIPAVHFQDHLVPTDAACYTCHTDYAQFGTLQAKLEGLHHVWVQYFGTPMKPIHLYQPFNNQTCLHCHAGARQFEEDPTHSAMMSLLASGTLSCVSSGCHDMVHDVGQLPKQKFWSPKP